VLQFYVQYLPKSLNRERVKQLPRGSEISGRLRQIYYFLWGGSWPSGQRGALASRRSQTRIPAVAVNLLSVLICCWPLIEFACLLCYPDNTLCSQRLELPEGLGRHCTNPQIYLFYFFFFIAQRNAQRLTSTVWARTWNKWASTTWFQWRAVWVTSPSTASLTVAWSLWTQVGTVG
jgi:hypothetical protein